MPGNHLRNFAKYFTNLTPGQQREFELALKEIQDSADTSNISRSVDLLKRTPDQGLPIPQPEIVEGVRGGIVRWPALQDQFIAFYEVDVDETSTFPSPDTVTTYTNQTVIEGLVNSVFVRVRGVRLDGSATPYSETLSILPRLFDIEIHTEEAFYVTVTGTDPNVVVGGDGSNLDYLPINEESKSMVWGFLSTYGDPGISIPGVAAITARIVKRFKDGPFTTDEEVIFNDTVSDFFDSQSLGPVIIGHPETGQRIELRLEVTDTSTGFDGSGNLAVRTEDRTEVFWAHLNAMELGIDES